MLAFNTKCIFILDKLLGLDAPPPPTPPPPPVPTPVPTISRPASRSANSTPAPTSDSVKIEDLDKDKNTPSSSSKEAKKALASKALDFVPLGKKSNTDFSGDIKKDRLINPLPMPSASNHPGTKPAKLNKKKQLALMQHNAATGMLHSNSNNYANMLLKKAKKQKPPLMPGAGGPPMLDKPKPEKPSKLEPAEKTQRKYIKMLQKMAKQGKIPAELLNNIMISDKKSKILNPQILQVLPPGPEKIQLEKLLKKHAKQRQKQIKQQMMQEAQKLKKSNQASTLPPPLVPLFTPPTPVSHPHPPPPTLPLSVPQTHPLKSMTDVNTLTPLSVNLDEEKPKFIEQKDVISMSPMKQGFTSNIPSPGQQPPLPPMQIMENIMSKSLKSPVKTGDTNPVTPVDNLTATPIMPPLTSDGKELKLSNEPDRSKLNIFKKISKQKTPKSSSPTPLRIPTGMADAPIINLPSGTTITPTPGPGPSSTVGRNLFPPLPAENSSSNIINLDDIKDSPPHSLNVSHPPPPSTIATDLTQMNRVFGEKPPGGVEPTKTVAAPTSVDDMANKPKKRGRKPGSKNSPKIPGVIPPHLLKKNKKMKMDPKLFNPQMPLTHDFASAMTGGNLSFDNVAQLFGNPINPMEWAQNKQLQQQMLIMAAAKERKEQKKKNKMMKQDIQNSDKKNIMMTPTTSNLPIVGNVPTNEEVLNINKKLMRMDTILKPAPSSSSSGNDLSVDTSLITGKKLPSPSLFPPAPSSTSPLKSPGAAVAASKRLMQGMEAMAAAAAAGLGQPFMLPNRPAFPNLPSNMLSMLPFPFTARPGLIPTPGLFPTPGLGAFQSNPKNPLLPGMFPFPNLKQSSGDTGSQGKYI